MGNGSNGETDTNNATSTDSEATPPNQTTQHNTSNDTEHETNFTAEGGPGGEDMEGYRDVQWDLIPTIPEVMERFDNPDAHPIHQANRLARTLNFLGIYALAGLSRGEFSNVSAACDWFDAARRRTNEDIATLKTVVDALVNAAQQAAEASNYVKAEALLVGHAGFNRSQARDFIVNIQMQRARAAGAGGGIFEALASMLGAGAPPDADTDGNDGGDATDPSDPGVTNDTDSNTNDDNKTGNDALELTGSSQTAPAATQVNFDALGGEVIESNNVVTDIDADNDERQFDSVFGGDHGI